MPLQTESFSLEQAFADLEAEREELADEIAQIPPADRTADNPEFVEKQTRSEDIERYLGGLEWVRDEFGDDVEFELRGLNTSETLVINDRVADLQAESVTPTKSVGSMATIFWVAEGLERAPFIDPGDDFEDKCAVVRGLPRQVTNYLEERVNDLTTVGEREGNSFNELVAEKTREYHPES